MNMRSILAAVILCATAAAARADDGYALDALPREAAGAVACPEVPLETYRGFTLALNRPAQVHTALLPSLRRLEKVVRRVAIEVYGRPPVRLVHAGAYSCRKIKQGRRWLSEHSLGNAIDILGVDFGPAKGRRGPRELRGAFEVRVKKDWKGGRGVAAIHSRFLRLLARRVIADEDFRVVLGPSHRDHGDHFHFDMAPYRLVDVFGERH